jgi:hypothetical protein
MAEFIDYDKNARSLQARKTFNVKEWKDKRTMFAKGIQLRTAEALNKAIVEIEKRLDVPQDLTTKEIISIAKVTAENLQRLSVIEQYYDGTRDPNKEQSPLNMSWQIIVNQADEKLRKALSSNFIEADLSTSSESSDTPPQ